MSEQKNTTPININIDTRHPNDEISVMECVHLLEELLARARKGAYRDIVVVASKRATEGYSATVFVRHTHLEDEFQMVGMVDAAKDFIKRKLEVIK